MQGHPRLAIHPASSPSYLGSRAIARRRFAAATTILFEQLASSTGDAGGVGEERLDGAGRVDRLVVEPAGQALELGGAFGQLGDAAVVDQAQPALDGAEEVVGVAQLGVDLRAR